MLPDIPEIICKPEDENFCIYIDTDSNYFYAYPILKFLNPNFDNLEGKEKDDLLEQVALKYQDVINSGYNQMAKDIFNIDSHMFNMKTECTIRSGFFSGKRRYAQYITRKDGVDVEDIDVKGLDFMKSNFPPVFGDFFNEILNKILFGSTREEIDQQILDFKDSMKDMPLTDIAKPTAVKKLKQHIGTKQHSDQIFTSIKTVIGKKGKTVGAPAPVKGAIYYNDLLRFKGLNNKHNLIIDGDKVKWVYLKDNPYKIEMISFFDYDLPKEIRSFIETYVDRNKAFNTILKNKLESFYKDLNWGALTLNPYSQQFFSF